MKEIITPIIVKIDNSDIEYFDSPEKAAASMEPADVEDGLFEAYDAEGKLLSIKVTYKKLETPFLFRPIFFMLDILGLSYNEKIGVVSITLEPDSQDKKNKLKEVLVKYLKNQGANTESKSLPELVRILCNK